MEADDQPTVAMGAVAEDEMGNGSPDLDPQGPDEPPEEGKRRTEYVLLRAESGPDGTVWREISTVEARSGNEAIRQAVGDAKAHDGEELYRAVPKRSWRGLKVTSQTKTVVDYEEID